MTWDPLISSCFQLAAIDENRESGSIEASLENAVFSAILERNGDSMKQKRWKDFNSPPSNEDGGSKNGSYEWCIKSL